MEIKFQSKIQQKKIQQQNSDFEYVEPNQTIHFIQKGRFSITPIQKNNYSFSQKSDFYKYYEHVRDLRNKIFKQNTEIENLFLILNDSKIINEDITLQKQNQQQRTLSLQLQKNQIQKELLSNNEYFDKLKMENDYQNKLAQIKVQLKAVKEENQQIEEQCEHENQVNKNLIIQKRDVNNLLESYKQLETLQKYQEEDIGILKLQNNILKEQVRYLKHQFVLSYCQLVQNKVKGNLFDYVNYFQIIKENKLQFLNESQLLSNNQQLKGSQFSQHYKFKTIFKEGNFCLKDIEIPLIFSILPKEFQQLSFCSNSLLFLFRNFQLIFQRKIKLLATISYFQAFKSNLIQNLIEFLRSLNENILKQFNEYDLINFQVQSQSGINDFKNYNSLISFFQQNNDQKQIMYSIKINYQEINQQFLQLNFINYKQLYLECTDKNQIREQLLLCMKQSNHIAIFNIKKQLKLNEKLSQNVKIINSMLGFINNLSNK